tara:strand:+ start:189 stop:527 length:339 start_codon:yes stop_codon:yes gene_type:complete
MAEEKGKKTEVKKEEVKQEKKTAKASFDAHQIIKYPLSTEKSIRQIEFDNKLVFVVHPRATKRDVKRAVEELFDVKVVGVNIQNSFRGDKRAYVKLGPESLASDVSADLGLI